MTERSEGTENTAPLVAAERSGAVTGGERPLSVRVHREDGHPVSSAALTLIDQRGQQVARAAGGNDGVYQVATPAAGQYVLIASASGYQPTAITVIAGDHHALWELTLRGNGELSGTVTAADGQPLAGVAITLADLRGEVVTAAVTGSDGVYTGQGTVAGTYTLVAVAEGRRPHATTLTIPDSGTLRYDIELASESVLSGRAWSGSDAVADAQVSVLDATGRVVDSVFTDSEGNYRIPDLPAGDYTVMARGYPQVSSQVRISGANNTHDVNLDYGVTPGARSAEFSSTGYNGASAAR